MGLLAATGVEVTAVATEISDSRMHTRTLTKTDSILQRSGQSVLNQITVGYGAPLQNLTCLHIVTRRERRVSDFNGRTFCQILKSSWFYSFRLWSFSL